MPESHVRRTESEVRLSLETSEANYRDQLMFDRLVRGGCHCQQNDYVRPATPRELLPKVRCYHHNENEIMGDMPQLRQRRRSLQEMGNWAIEGFEEDEDDGTVAVTMSNLYCREFSSTEETELMPFTCDSEDGFSHHDDEVFDLDL